MGNFNPEYTELENVLDHSGGFSIHCGIPLLIILCLEPSAAEKQQDQRDNESQKALERDTRVGGRNKDTGEKIDKAVSQRDEGLSGLPT